MGDDDGGDHMKDAGLGLPPGVKTRVFPSLELENGAVLRDVVCAYSTYGELSATRDNVVVVGHSLTSNSCVHEWWGEMLGDGAHFAMNTREDFVVCVNYLGSPYGTASPITMNPATPGRPYGADFPTPCTIRDNVRLQKMLLDAMGVAGVKLAIGGSMGCMLALEWGASYPSFVSELCLIAGCGRHSDWATGIGECERFAIMADGRWNGGEYDARDPPLGGLAAARMTAMLTYRSPAGADEKFGRRDASGTDAKGTRDATKNQATKPPAHPELGVASHSNENATTAKSLPFTAVESYLQYQGRKFTRRFDANCYVQLTYTLDSHDVSRGREGSYEDVMRGITQRSMVVGITSDVLYPFHLQREMVRTLPNSRMFAIDSVHGHDGFLLEIDGLNKAVRAFRDEGATTTTTTTGENLRGNAFADDANPDYDRDPLPPAPSYGAVNVGFVAALRSVCVEFDRDGFNRVLTSAAEKKPYAGDMGHHPRATPDVVVLPSSTAETAKIVRLCYERRVPVVTRGAGTGLEGGCVPYDGGLVLDTSLLKARSVTVSHWSPYDRVGVVNADP